MANLVSNIDGILQIWDDGTVNIVGGKLQIDASDVLLNNNNADFSALSVDSLKFSDNSPTLSESGNYLRVQTTDGYIDIGANNTSYAHFYTDRPSFFFGSTVRSGGNQFESHTGDLALSRIGSTTARLRVTAGTTISDQDFDVTGDVTISGDLTVSGNTVTLNTTTITAEDAVILLNSGQTTPVNDIGLVFQRYSSATAANYNPVILWEESSDKFVFGSTTESAADADIGLNTQWLVVTGSGNVGIGSNTPTDALVVSNGSTPTIFVGKVGDTTHHANMIINRGSTSYDANLMYKTNNVTKWRIWLDGLDNTLQVRDESNNANVMTWETGGNVGIGIDDPTNKLHVASSTATDGILIDGSNTSGPALIINSTASSGKKLGLISNNTSNTDGAGLLQFWNFTNSHTFATWGTTSGSQSRVYTNLAAMGDTTNATLTGAGQLALKRANNNPFLSFHDNAGARSGYIQSVHGDDLLGFYDYGTYRFESLANNTTVEIKAKDAGLSLLQVGKSTDGTQGTGAVEVTQDGTHGGGISYNGDTTPAFVTGESADHVTFYRLDAGTRTEVFHYPYSSSTVNFNSTPTVGTNTIFHDGYHPTADAWTTSRTLTLTGDVTGSVSWNGSANASITSTVDKIDGRAFRNGDSTNGTNPDNIAENGTSYINSISLFGQTDGALYSQAYSSSWVHQIFGDYRTGNLAVRGKNNGSWTSWSTVWSSNNDGASSGLDADLLDGLQGSSYLRSDADDTMTGDLLLDASNAEINIKSGAAGTSGAVNWTFNTTGTNYASIKLPYDTRATTGLHIDSGYPITIDATTRIDFDISGTTYATLDTSGLSIGSNDVFHDGYHPNADKWTTARTLSLSGDASGSVSWDGSSDVTLSVTVANDSHTHDTRYLRSDTADTATGKITFSGGHEAQAIFKSGATDFDSLKLSGTYSLYNVNASGHTNAPFQYGAMITAGNTAVGGGMAMQIAHERTGTGTYIRGMNDTGDTWYDWDEIWTSGTDGSGSGLDADLLDGQQGSYYQKKTVVQDAAPSGVSGDLWYESDTGTLFVYYGSAWIDVAPGVESSTNLQINSLGVGTAASGTAGEIRATNDVTAYYSDKKLKDFHGNIDSALDKVNQLNGYYFTENETAKKLGYNNDKRQVGVSAQEVEAVLPEIVTAAPISDEYLTVKYEKLAPLFIEAIKEIDKKYQDKIDMLMEEIQKLKDKN
jgi:hypothetical protein